MQIIYKYPVPSEDKFMLMLPLGAHVLTVQSQNNEPQLWALVDPQQPLEPRHFRLVATGQQLADPFDKSSYVYIGTFQLLTGRLVFHLFEI